MDHHPAPLRPNSEVALRTLALTLLLVTFGCDAGSNSRLSSGTYRAIFSLDPVAAATQYSGRFVYCVPNDEDGMVLRSPLFWLHCNETPTYVFEGAENGNWDVSRRMADENSNPRFQFLKIPGHDRFSVIAPLTEKLAELIVKGKVNMTEQMLQSLR